MKWSIPLLIIIFLGSLNSRAQYSLDNFTNEVVTNNVNLKTQQSKIKADVMNLKVANNLANPEFDTDYLWANPEEYGDFYDFAISQDFDFPTVYVHRKRLLELREKQAEYTEQEYKLALRLEAANIWVSIVACNRRIKNQHERIELIDSKIEKIKNEVLQGKTTQVAYNKVGLIRLHADQKLQRLEQEKSLLQLAATTLNGGVKVSIDETDYIPVILPTDSARWLSNVINAHPTNKWYETQQDAADRSIKLSKSDALPKFTAGYLNQQSETSKYNGITFSIYLPLWGTRNTVKLTRLEREASVSEQADFLMQKQLEFLQLYETVDHSLKRVNDFRDQMKDINQLKQIDEALQKGEINRREYLVEIGFVYDLQDSFELEEKGLQQDWVKLYVLSQNGINN